MALAASISPDSRAAPLRRSLRDSILRAQGRKQLRIVPGLLHEIGGAALHGFHRQPDAAPSRHHDHGQGAVELLHARQQVQAFLAGSRVEGVVQVHQQHVVLAVVQPIQHGFRRVYRFDLVAFPLQQQVQRFQNIRLVVGD